jgi:hypothetical protein
VVLSLEERKKIEKVISQVCGEAGINRWKRERWSTSVSAVGRVASTGLRVKKLDSQDKRDHERAGTRRRDH